MTKIDTDNPIVEYWVTCCDFIWQHLPVLSIVLLVAMVLIYIWFKHWQKEWDEKMLNDKRTWEEHMKELKVNTLSRKSDIERQLYESDVVELDNLISDIERREFTKKEEDRFYELLRRYRTNQ